MKATKGHSKAVLNNIDPIEAVDLLLAPLI